MVKEFLLRKLHGIFCTVESRYIAHAVFGMLSKQTRFDTKFLIIIDYPSTPGRFCGSANIRHLAFGTTQGFRALPLFLHCRKCRA